MSRILIRNFTDRIFFDIAKVQPKLLLKINPIVVIVWVYAYIFRSLHFMQHWFYEILREWVTYQFPNLSHKLGVKTEKFWVSDAS